MANLLTKYSSYQSSIDTYKDEITFKKLLESYTKRYYQINLFLPTSTYLYYLNNYENKYIYVCDIILPFKDEFYKE